MNPLVHDLVRVDGTLAERWHEAPAWVGRSLTRAPWLVVRRERGRRLAADAVPVGVRGAVRPERYAAVVSYADVREIVTPLQIDVAASRDSRLREAFVSLAGAAAEANVRIAPAGSYAFEVASGVPTTHAASDLDILVYPQVVTRDGLRAFLDAIDAVSARIGVRIDAELVCSAGGAALREALAPTPLVLFKTATGPELLPCPV